MNEELAREAVGLLGIAAAALIEEAHPALVTPVASREDYRNVARALRQLGSDLTALAGAAEVLASSIPAGADVTDRL